MGDIRSGIALPIPFCTNILHYEHYLMNKLKNLLRVSHGQLIDAKLKVIKEKKEA